MSYATIPALRRYTRVLQLSIVLVLVTNLAPSILGIVAWRDPWFPGLAGGKLLEGVVRIGPLIAILTCGIIEHCSLWKRVRASAGGLCGNCLYDLSASPPAGTCPECGTPYKKDALRDRWMRVMPTAFMGPRRRDSDP